MSGHPGCTVKDMAELAEYIRDNRLYTEQVQDFTPTPMSVSTCCITRASDPLPSNGVRAQRPGEEGAAGDDAVTANRGTPALRARRAPAGRAGGFDRERSELSCIGRRYGQPGRAPAATAVEKVKFCCR